MWKCILALAALVACATAIEINDAAKLSITNADGTKENAAHRSRYNMFRGNGMRNGYASEYVAAGDSPAHFSEYSPVHRSELSPAHYSEHNPQSMPAESLSSSGYTGAYVDPEYVYPEQGVYSGQGMETSTAAWMGMMFMMMAVMICVCIGVCMAGAACGAMAYKVLMVEQRRTVVKYDDVESGQ